MKKWRLLCSKFSTSKGFYLYTEMFRGDILNAINVITVIQLKTVHFVIENTYNKTKSRVTFFSRAAFGIAMIHSNVFISLVYLNYLPLFCVRIQLSFRNRSPTLFFIFEVSVGLRLPKSVSFLAAISSRNCSRFRCENLLFLVLFASISLRKVEQTTIAEECDFVYIDCALTVKTPLIGQ